MYSLIYIFKNKLFLQKLRELKFIVGPLASKLPIMLSLTIFLGVLELLGLSLIIPFLTAIQSPDKLSDMKYWQVLNDFFLLTNFESRVIVLSLILLGVFTFKIVLNCFIQNLIIKFSYKLQASLRERLAISYMRAPYLFHTRKRTNDIINTMLGHVSQFSKGIVGSLLKVFSEGIVILTISIFLIAKFPITALFSISLIMMFVWFYVYKIKGRIAKLGSELSSASSELIKTLNQGIKGLKEARVLGKTEHFENHIMVSSNRLSKINAETAFHQILPRFLLEFLIISVILIALLTQIMVSGKNTEIINNLILFGAASIRLLPSINNITVNLNQIYFAAPMTRQILDDLRETGDGAFSVEKKATEPLISLEFKNLSFQFLGSENKILDKVNFSIKRGEVVGVFGPSGSGKTTFMNIILGLIEFQSGEIILNKKMLTTEEWKRLLISSYVPQSPTIIDGSVRENIAFGEDFKEFDEQKIQISIEKAQLNKFVETLAYGADTVVGENAVLFSGGQKHRLAISRSFYFERGLIILDEVTAALDKKTEIELLGSIKELKKHSAVILVSHSDQVKEFCDKVYNLNMGKLIEKNQA